MDSLEQAVNVNLDSSKNHCIYTMRNKPNMMRSCSNELLYVARDLCHVGGLRGRKMVAVLVLVGAGAERG